MKTEYYKVEELSPRTGAWVSYSVVYDTIEGARQRIRQYRDAWEGTEYADTPMRIVKVVKEETVVED